MIKQMSAAAVLATGGLSVLLGLIEPAAADETKKPEYQNMAPVDQYRMATPADEIALARSAAPDSVSSNADVLILGEHGYETAVKGSNGFACVVLRSWAASFDDAEFWNAKIRSPICYNAAAVSTVLPIELEKTRWVLTGVSDQEMRARSKASSLAHKVPAPGAMAFMMSKQQHLSDSDGHWHPHLMMYEPHADVSAWGANLPGSPIFGFESSANEPTVLVVKVVKWSDGSSATDMH